MDKISTDKSSGKDTLGPQLDALFTFVRDDTVVVHNMDLLGRNLDALRWLVQELTNNQMTRRDVVKMINRRALEAGVDVSIGCHTF